MTCPKCQGEGNYERPLNNLERGLSAFATFGFTFIIDEMRKKVATTVVTCETCQGTGQIDYLPYEPQPRACSHSWYISSQNGDEVTLKCHYCSAEKTA